MLSIQDLIKNCMNQSTDPKSQTMMESALEKLQSSQPTVPAVTVTPECANLIEKAATAAQSGDKQQALSIMQEILATPEGSALAQQLKFLLR